MIIRDCMKKNVFAVSAKTTIKEAIAFLAEHHFGLLPVLDDERRLLGVVGLSDLLNLALPAVVHMLRDVDYIGDFGAIEKYQPSPEVLARPITTLMRPGTVVRDDSGLIRSYALMLQHELHDLPVVDQDGRLIGIASRVDIGTTILNSWQKD